VRDAQSARQQVLCSLLRSHVRTAPHARTLRRLEELQELKDLNSRRCARQSVAEVPTADGSSVDAVEGRSSETSTSDVRASQRIEHVDPFMNGQISSNS
jgi:hypothetical protein